MLHSFFFKLKKIDNFASTKDKIRHILEENLISYNLEVCEMSTIFTPVRP